MSADVKQQDEFLKPLGCVPQIVESNYNSFRRRISVAHLRVAVVGSGKSYVVQLATVKLNHSYGGRKYSASSDFS
jgi:hypothetical protein